MMEQIDMFSNDPGLKPVDTRSKLEREYLVPPFSILDTRQGYWQDRKRLWLSLGIESEIGRTARTFHDDEWLYEKKGQKMPGFHEEIFNSCQGRDSKGKNTFQDLIDNPRQAESAKLIAAVGGQSIFDPVLCELMYRWFCPKHGKILDPFAGGSVRGIVASILGYRYHGIDLSAEQIAANKEQATKLKVDGINWYIGDSIGLDKILPENFYADMIFTCPPYFDLEQYTSDASDLSNTSWQGFKIMYRKIIEKSILRLWPNRFACFVVSEIRDDNGCFRGLVPYTIDCFVNGGMWYYNEIILVNSVGSLPIRMANQFSYRKIGRTHQNVLIFYKGNVDSIPKLFKEIKQDGIKEYSA